MRPCNGAFSGHEFTVRIHMWDVVTNSRLINWVISAGTDDSHSAPVGRVLGIDGSP